MIVTGKPYTGKSGYKFFGMACPVKTAKRGPATDKSRVVGRVQEQARPWKGKKKTRGFTPLVPEATIYQFITALLAKPEYWPKRDNLSSNL